jgi:hypothetical protein
MAQFIKGQTGNINGRPRGAKGKTSEVIRDNIRRFLAKNMAALQKDYDKLEPKDRLLLFERLLKYIVPNADFDLSKLSSRDLDLLIDRLRDKHLTPNQNNKDKETPVMTIKSGNNKTGS